MGASSRAGGYAAWRGRSTRRRALLLKLGSIRERGTRRQAGDVPKLDGAILMPGDPSECRKNAARCAELAATATPIEAKAAYGELAQQWEAVTMQLEELRWILSQDGPDNS
jgi:hypothetical protein